jgi:endo-1,4-beta-xylanase
MLNRGLLIVTVGFIGCDDGGAGPADAVGSAPSIVGGTSGVSVGSSGGNTFTNTPLGNGGATNAVTAPVFGGVPGTTTVTSEAMGGSTFFVSTTTATLTKFVGNITTNNSADTGGLTYSKYWNQITPENAGKWGSVQQSPTSNFNWSTLDAIYEYATKNNIIFKQHAFVWGSQQPSPDTSITEAQVKTWMKNFCTRYPNTKLIDVVNEPPPHTTPGYANNIGGGTNGTWAWIVNAFKWAREACPNAVLILNDYNNIEWDVDSKRFIDIVKKAKAAGAPIDAVGAQSHDLDNTGVSVSTVKTLLGNLNSQTGLPVYITEFDISSTDDAAQLNLYKQYFPFFMETSYVKGVTVWGWIYGSTWSQAPNSGLVKNGKSRSAMTYLMGLLGRPAP